MSLVIETTRVRTGASPRPAPTATANGFLASLSAEDRAAVGAVAAPIRLSPDEAFWDRNETVEDVLFLTRGLMAELVCASGGKTALARLCGVEGIVGATASGRPTAGPAVALTECEGLHLPVGALQTLMRERATLRQAVFGYVSGLVDEVSRRAACAACHKLDQRLASLLISWDRLAPATDRMLVTHERLCEMLGAQRTTVTSLMRGFKTDRLIRTGRGWVKILDETELARRSCHCHPA